MSEMAERSTPKYKETTDTQEWRLPLNIFLFSLLGIAMFVSVVVGILYGPPGMRDRYIGLCVLGAYAVLVKTGIIKEKWADCVAKWVGRAMMFLLFVVGPLFTVVLVAKYLGWW